MENKHDNPNPTTTHKEIKKNWTKSSEQTDIPSDVLGSYTGTPLKDSGDKGERPIQDADDL